MMKATEIKNMSAAELDAKLAELKKDLVHAENAACDQPA
jgi:ribosomal protein L29